VTERNSVKIVVTDEAAVYFANTGQPKERKIDE
jgi:hypothetical protein